MDLLNLGCGGRFHPAWVNVDLNSSCPAVVAHDIRRPLPFAADSFDGVYHSHVLEHLTPADGQSLLAECHRVLRPGGTIRVVVPDLEAIAKNYLATLERAAKGDETATSDHDWMTIELLDQMVRGESGGQMSVALRSWHAQPLVRRTVRWERTGEHGRPRGTVPLVQPNDHFALPWLACNGCSGK